MGTGFRNQHRGDEFYTRREDVDDMLTQHIPVLSAPGVRVLCPCDTDKSAFVQFMLDHDIDVTWSNDLDYEQFDFAQFDFVITNPPFSCMGAFLRRIADAGCGGLVVMPLSSLGSTKGGEKLLQHGWIATDEGVPTRFETPNSGERKFGMIVVLRSPELKAWHASGTTKRIMGSGEKTPVMTDEGIPRYARACDVPEHFDGEIAVPITWAYIRYDPSKYQILDHRGFKVKGKYTFKSWIIKCKD